MNQHTDSRSSPRWADENQIFSIPARLQGDDIRLAPSGSGHRTRTRDRDRQRPLVKAFGEPIDVELSTPSNGLLTKQAGIVGRNDLLVAI